MDYDSERLNICHTIRHAADRLEFAMNQLEAGTRRHAEALLAWHHLMDAHCLLLRGQARDEDIQWATRLAKQIVSDSSDSGNTPD